jgi:hypothetical protein
MLGEALSLRACIRGGGDGSRGSGSTSMSSTMASVPLGENGSTGSSAASNRVRFFPIKFGSTTGGCKPLFDLPASIPLFAERTAKMKGCLFARNSFALGPSYKGPGES